MNTDKRTDEELNRIIAEWMGWTSVINHYGDTIGRPPASNGVYIKIPRYCTDLNAIHEAERKLHPCDWSAYAMTLRKIIQRDCNKAECYLPGTERACLIADIWFYGATARQRAEALVAVMQAS